MLYILSVVKMLIFKTKTKLIFKSSRDTFLVQTMNLINRTFLSLSLSFSFDDVYQNYSRCCFYIKREVFETFLTIHRRENQL